MSNPLFGRLFEKLRGRAPPPDATRRMREASAKTAQADVTEAKREEMLKRSRLGDDDRAEFLITDVELHPLSTDERYELPIASNEEEEWPVTHSIRFPCLSIEEDRFCYVQVGIEFKGKRSERLARFVSAGFPVASARGATDWFSQCSVDWIEDFVVIPAISDDPEEADLKSFFPDAFEDFVWAPDEHVLLAKMTEDRGYLLVMRSGLGQREDLEDLRSILLEDVAAVYEGVGGQST